MLLGCDGSSSFTRTHLFNSRLALQDIPQLVITGLSPRKESVGGLKSWMGDGIKASLLDVGSQFTSWTLIVPQTEAGQKASELVIPKRRLQMNNTPANTSTKASSGEGVTRDMTGEECRDLALQLLHPFVQTIPALLLETMSQTMPHLTSAHDNTDLHGENVPLQSYTSPNFHPGRVMLVGSAAHPLASTVHSNHATSLSITASYHLATLILTKKSKDYVLMDTVQSESPSTPEMLLLSHISQEYMTQRGGVGNKALKDTYTQAIWTKPGDGVWGSLCLMAGLSFKSWITGSLDDELTRGASSL